LAIIGVIAAITIPSIVANHQKKALETGFAKGYRTLSQAVNIAVSQHGGIANWDWKDSWSTDEMDQFSQTYFTPYLNIAKTCTVKNNATGCFPDVVYKELNGANFSNISKNEKREAVQLLLSDGMSINLMFLNNCITENDHCMEIYLDVNGHKKPNTIGRDLFSFYMLPAISAFAPQGVHNRAQFDPITKKYPLMEQAKIDGNCSKTGRGWLCATKMLQDGFKMNY